MKEAKDAPKFEKGDPVGDVNFPPHYVKAKGLVQHIKRYAIFPAEDIEGDKFPALMSAVFQYTFRYTEKADADEDTKDHAGDPTWTIMWDYNIGLVRITPFFKCQGYQKVCGCCCAQAAGCLLTPHQTIPAKVIQQNSGLSDLCHSITGGSLAAQGYWMPYEAAKMIASTFCWKIRYALVPLFGSDFVDLCTHPTDPAYRRFLIDPAVSERCAMGYKHVRNKGLRQHTQRSISYPQGVHSSITAEEFHTPKPRPLRPRPSRRVQNAENERTMGAESSQTDTEGAPSAISTPSTGPRASSGIRHKNSVDIEWLAANERVQRGSKRGQREIETDSEAEYPRPSQLPNKRKRKIGVFTLEEARAAHQLLELRYSRPDA
ncbi:MAG: hypothetical protein Q9162_000492 [Coniocarpon cinnabarinum]